MSFKYLNLAWEAEVPHASIKLVLLSLADQANDDGICYPGQNSIAKRTGLGRRTVTRAIQNLESAGWLVVAPRGGSGEGRDTNVYKLSATMAHWGQSATSDRQSATTTPKPSVEPSVSLSTRARRATQFPHTEIPDTWVKVCNEKRPDLDPGRLFEIMKTWCEANGKTYKNWDAAWRNWMMKEQSHAKPNGRGKESRDERLAREQREFADSPEGRAALAALEGLSGSL